LTREGAEASLKGLVLGNFELLPFLLCLAQYLGGSSPTAKQVAGQTPLDFMGWAEND